MYYVLFNYVCIIYQVILIKLSYIAICLTKLYVFSYLWKTESLAMSFRVFYVYMLFSYA